MQRKRLVVVSNRLPSTFGRTAGGGWQSMPSTGGLVSALVPVLRHRGGVWVGWPGVVAEDAPDLPARQSGSGFVQRAVSLARDEHQLYYNGFANEVVWPLFHDLQGRCNFEPDYWRAYLGVNRKFAAATAAELQPGDCVWIHDYHLMAVARELRAAGVRESLNFFLHIPFPPLDIFAKLPWRQELLELLLDFDLVGLQTPRDRRNFLTCVEALLPRARVDRSRPLRLVHHAGRAIRVGAFPIGIDVAGFARAARSPSVVAEAQSIRAAMPGRHLLLGVDRLDYTKGIAFRLRAFDEALRRHPELIGQATLVQVAVPSRETIPQYAQLRSSVEELVGRINGELGRPGWMPVHYLYRALDSERLLAFYRAADVALVTPLKDGMNLVAKEYCAAKVDRDGVLVLSEFAGAAAQLERGALLVNPYDVEGMAEQIHVACTMPVEERSRRMRRMRRVVRTYDIFWWLDSYLEAALARDLGAFPRTAKRDAETVGLVSEVASDDAALESAPTMA